MTRLVCTQPRRLATIAVAQRVAEERGCPLGDEVGYQIRLESKRSRDTRLLFCTHGILIKQLEGDVTLGEVTHVIVDEVRWCDRFSVVSISPVWQHQALNADRTFVSPSLLGS